MEVRSFPNNPCVNAPAPTFPTWLAKNEPCLHDQQLGIVGQMSTKLSMFTRPATLYRRPREHKMIHVQICKHLSSINSIHTFDETHFRILCLTCTNQMSANVAMLQVHRRIRVACRPVATGNTGLRFNFPVPDWCYGAGATLHQLSGTCSHAPPPPPTMARHENQVCI